MHKTGLLLLGATGLLLTGVAAASQREEHPDDIICKTERATRSRISSRSICLTRADWRAIVERRQRESNEAMGRTDGFRGPPGRTPG